MLAKRGVSGFAAPIEGEGGFLAAVGSDQFDSAPLLERLGEAWRGSEVSFKPWPCCRGTHAYAEAGLRLKARDGFMPGEARRIVAVVSEKNRMLCEPLTQKQRPDTAIGAKFSIPFVLATALCRGRIDLASFSPKALADPEKAISNTRTSKAI